MAKQVSLPLGTAFYKELAAHAWESLEDAQKEQLRQFLVLRFIDSGNVAFDDLTEARARTRFASLLEDGRFDEQLDAALGNDSAKAAIGKAVSDSICDVVGHVKQSLENRWKQWIHDVENGYPDRLNKVVESALEQQKIDELIERAIERHMDRYGVDSVALIQRVVSNKLEEKFGTT